MGYLTENLTKIEHPDSLDYWIHPDKNYTFPEIKEALLKENIIFDGYGVFPILIIKQENNQYNFVIGEEDDGRIQFKKDNQGHFCNAFNTRWTYHLIEMFMKGLIRIQNGKVE